MNVASAYYSIIQFCPSPERGEAVNIGVLLFSPTHSFLRAQFSASLKRPKRLFARDGLFDAEGLRASRTALEQRLVNDAASFQSLADLESFVRTRATDLRLTPPRSVKVSDPESELSELFAEVVGGKESHTPAGPIFPELDGLFVTLERQGRARLNEKVRIPILERDLHIPYAYQNGRLNLILPKRFSANERRALDAASLLAIEGNLLQRHPSELGERRLVIASEFLPSADPGLQDRVHRALSEYEVQMIASNELHAFIRRVQNEAHAA